MGDALNSKDGEALNLIIVAGVITEGAFFCHFIGVQKSLENKFSGGGDLQVIADTFDHLSFLATQQASKRIFR